MKNLTFIFVLGIAICRKIMYNSKDNLILRFGVMKGMTLMFELMRVFAEGENAAEAAAVGGPAQMLTGIVPLLLMVAVFYFILIRPQRKKEKALRQMIADLRMGDEVVTVGGIHGKIVRIKDDTFVLESGAGTNKSYIQVDRSAVSRLTKEADNSKKVTPLPEELESAETEEKTEE